MLEDLNLVKIMIAGPTPVDVDVPHDLSRADPTHRTAR
jgi:hypothetical protein